MAQNEWEPAEIRQLAADLRRFAETVRGHDCSRLKRLARELDFEAAEMEAIEERWGIPVTRKTRISFGRL